MVRPYNNNFAGIGACDSCGNGFQFSSALNGVRAQIQLLRNYADINSRDHQHPRSAGARAVGEQSRDRRLQLRPLLRQGPRAAVERHGQRQLGDARRTTRPSCCSVYNQMLTDSGQPGQCPPDGLLFGPLTAAGPVPGEPAPAGSRHRDDAVGRHYVLNGDGNVTAYNGAPAFGSPPTLRLPTRSATSR